MPKAIWNGVVVAESDKTKMIEGNHYFPPDSINWDYFEKTEKNTTCFWKGIASYYTLKRDGSSVPNAAWTYEDPAVAAAAIKDHIAFYRSQVKIED